jgi:hypothetical protein
MAGPVSVGAGGTGMVRSQYILLIISISYPHGGTRQTLLRWLGGTGTSIFQRGRAMPTQRGDHTEANPTEARQGFLDRPVLIVLVVSLALIIMAFGILVLPTLI